MNLTEVLDSAIGSGSDVGSLNLKYLKTILAAILLRLDINAVKVPDNDVPEISDVADDGETGQADNEQDLEKQTPENETSDAKDLAKQMPELSENIINAAKNSEVSKRLADLEQAVEEMNRPNSPNTIIEDSKQGVETAKKEWEIIKVKKRVDANEEGIDKFNSLIDQLAKQVHEVQENSNTMRDDMDSTKTEHGDILSKLRNGQEDLQKQMDEMKEKPENISQVASNDVGDTVAALKSNIAKLEKKCEENLQSIEESCVKWKDLNDTFSQEVIDTELEKSYAEERENFPSYFEGLSSLSNCAKKIEKLKGVVDIMDSNIENLRQSTDENTKGLETTIENVEKSEQVINVNTESISEMEERLQGLLEQNKKLANELAEQKLATQREMDNQQQYINQNITPHQQNIDQDTVDRMQDALSGTEDELARLRAIIDELNKDGENQNKELLQLQDLLKELQEKAAMSDFVISNLDQKADKADFEGLLSKGDLDETAQAIIDQLEDLIMKQATFEANLQNRISCVDDEVSQRTKVDEFNPFKDEIENKLRSLRKKIENAKQEDLDNLTTAAGAAGFRRQLFNCISCDKPHSMRTGQSVLNLPQASFFPSRVTLRPHTTFDMDTARALTKSNERVELGPLRNDFSNATNYSQLVVEKEFERRRKQRENRLRQENNPYSFQSGKLPRSAGGAIHAQRTDNYHVLRDKNDVRYQEANIEGTDGMLYKGRVKKTEYGRSRPYSAYKQRDVTRPSSRAKEV